MGVCLACLNSPHHDCCVSAGVVSPRKRRKLAATLTHETGEPTAALSARPEAVSPLSSAASSSAVSSSMPAKESSVLFTVASLPHNWHSCSLAQLRAVCAAHAYRPRGRSKAAIVEEIEMILMGE